MKGALTEFVVADRLERSGSASPFASHRGAHLKALITGCLCCMLGLILWSMRDGRPAGVPGQYAAVIEEADPDLPGASQRRMITASDEKSGYRATLADDLSMYYGWGALTDDATRLVFVGARKDFRGELSDPGLYVAEVVLDQRGRPQTAGHAAKAVALVDIPVYTIRPAWMGDRNRVLYNAPVRLGKRFVHHIYLADLRTRKVIDLTPRSVFSAANPAYSEQAAMVAFTGRTFANGQTRWDIYTVRPDGTGLRRLTHPGNNNGTFNTCAQWTDDGREIIYRTSGSLQRIPADGSAPPRPSA